MTDIELEELAKKLYLTQWIIPPNEFNELDSDKRHQWLCTARFVAALVVKARLEEYRELCQVEKPCSMELGLEYQLTALRGEK